MAIFHFNQRHIQRSLGLSVVEQAAKITGESFVEMRTKRTFNYKKLKQRIVISKTFFPVSCEHLEAFKFWNDLENYEDAYAELHYKKPETIENYKNTACVAMLIRVALPIELSKESQITLVEEFAKQRFVKRCLVVTYGIHETPNNPHAFLLILRRPLDERGNIVKRKDREICERSELIVTRELWADLVNDYLEKKGFEARVTHKSFADLGIKRLPSRRLGWRHHQQKRMMAQKSLAMEG